jgi:hypothetical protein
MASGDAQRTWFPEMITMLHQTWAASMSENELLALRDRLETTLETIRSERHILPAMMWCPHCQARHRSAPPKVSVRAMILALGRFGMASASEVKALERRWNTYRKRHQLDRYGMKA